MRAVFAARALPDRYRVGFCEEISRPCRSPNVHCSGANAAATKWCFYAIFNQVRNAQHEWKA
jgi:hypothetical protein